MSNGSAWRVMMSWRSGLHRRGFISTGGGGAALPADRQRLVPPQQLHVADVAPAAAISAASADAATAHRPRRNSPRRKSVKYVLWGAAAVALVVAAALCGALLGGGGGGRREPPDPLTAPPPSWSRQHHYRRAAVCTDGPPCSEIGKRMLDKNGSAVDAAIAAMFCNGLVNMASMGIGGGFFMTVYVRGEERAYSVVARETAPGAASEDMYANNSMAATRGGLAVGVPGEVRGMWEAHRRWGVLPWSELVAPSIQLCRGGFNMSLVLYDIVRNNEHIMKDAQLRKLLFDEKTKKPFRAGTLLHPHETLCHTLQRLADDGGDEFYTGQLARDVQADLADAGGAVTPDDLRLYRVNISDPIAVELSLGDTLYTPPPPSSGLLLGFILNILSGFNFSNESIASTNATVLTYHRIVEAFKYAFATRTQLGDMDFLNLTDLIRNVTSREFAAEVRGRIDDTRTFNDPEHYGAHFVSAEDSGTAQISIIAPNGDAVSLTSSINYYFGAGFTGSRTGIIFNNVMDDFSSPTFINYFGFPPSPANFIRPHKRPLSSMSPAIIVDSDKNVKMVIGASGGSKITTAVALVVMRKIWFGQSIKQAVDAPRFHHQVLPMAIDYEYGMIKDVVDGLKALGHNMTRYRDRGSIVCPLFRNRTTIIGNADYRKGGEVYGID